jgi:hypothetical protein
MKTVKPDPPEHFNEGVGGHDDQAHVIGCTSSGCRRCKWVVNKETWGKAFPWLGCRLDLGAKKFGLGCEWCHVAAQSDTLSKVGLHKSEHHAFKHFAYPTGATTDIKRQKMERHEQTPAHRVASG